MTEVVTQPSVIEILSPRSIAIVGASERHGSWAGNVRRNLIESGFTGPLWSVNPKYSELFGEPAYPTVADLPGPVDHVIVVVPREQVEEALRGAAARGATGATIITSGFADTGDDEGRVFQDRIMAVAREAGIRVIGPNCFGWVSMLSNIDCMAYPRMPQVEPGPLAVISQSGGAVPLIMAACAERGIGLSLGVSIGNAADVSMAEVIRAAADDEQTQVVGLLLETVVDWPEFFAACAYATTQGTHVVAVKVGRSEGGREASQTHTGRMAGDFEMFAAAFKRVGGVLAANLDELIDVVDLHSSGNVPVGTRLKMLVTSGNLRALVHDAIDGTTLELPPLEADTVDAITATIGVDGTVANPVDAGFKGVLDDDVFLAVAEHLAREPDTDMLAVFGKLETRFEQRYIRLAAMAREVGVPLTLFGRITGNITDEHRAVRASTQLPYLPTVERLVAAIEAVTDASVGAETEPAPPPPAPPPALIERPAAPDGMLDHWAASALLTSLGVTVAPQELAADPAEAAVAAGRVGFPVVAKLVATGISHKTEVGGVRLGLATAADVRDAAEELLAIAPGAGILIQPMVAGAEVIVGARTDPELGAFVVIGSGGVLAEIIGDAVTVAAPLSADEAKAAVRRTMLGRLVDGYRGKPPLDIDALAALVVAVGGFAAANASWLAGLDLNPVMLRARGEGAVVVDARIELSPVEVPR